MTTKSRFLRYTSIVVLLPLLLLSCGDKQKEQQHTTSTLGLAIPLSGSLAWLGANIQDGINLYLEQHPDLNNKLKIITEDVTTNETSRGVSALKKLIDIDKVDTMIVANSGVLEGTKSDIDRQKVVTFGIVGTDAMKGMKYGVKHWVTTQAEANTLASKVRDLNITRVAIATSEHQGYINREESVQAELAALNNNNLLVYSQRSTNQDDLPGIALKIKQFNPEVVIILLFPGQVGILAKELKKLGVSAQYLGTVSASDPADLKISEGALANLLYCDVPFSAEFESSYKAKYGKKPAIGAPNGYDIVKIIHSAMHNGISPADRDKFNNFIRQKIFTGSMGTYSFVDDGNNTFNFPMTLKAVN